MNRYVHVDYFFVFVFIFLVCHMLHEYFPQFSIPLARIGIENTLGNSVVKAKMILMEAMSTSGEW